MRHVLDEARLAASGRSLEQERQTRLVRGVKISTSSPIGS